MSRAVSQPVARAALASLLLLLAACIFLPPLLPWSATAVDPDVPRAAGPSWAHPLGTDPVGRDVLARTLVAGRFSMGIGAFVATVTTLLAAVVGGAAGAMGGWVDRAITWSIDVLMSIPTIPMLVALSVLVASPDSQVGGIVRWIPEPARIGLVLSVLGWMGTARVVRALVQSVRHEPYVEAATAAGAGRLRVVFRHLVPQTWPTLALFGTLGVGGAIMSETFLSFLGMGVNPPVPTWGNMIGDGSDLVALVAHPWIVAAPVAALAVALCSLNIVADDLRTVHAS